MTTIAFIGLGNMGGPMAINLQKAGHAVRAFDLSKEAVAKVVAEGATAAFSAQDAVQGAKVVVTMLPASQHVEALFLGKDGAPGLLASIAPGTLVIDSSTIAAATSQKVAKAADAAGIDFIDAPVSGGTGGAIAGTLTFMVGGTTAQLERAQPYLEKMGANIFHAGCGGGRPDRQDLQQRAAGHPDGGHQRSHCPGRGQRPGPQGAERDHAPQLRRQLGAGKVQPLPRRARRRPRPARATPAALART